MHNGCDVIIITYEQWFWYWKPYAISTQIHILWVRLARSEPVSPIDKACFSTFTGFSNSVLPGCESMRQTRILCYMVGDLRWSMCVRFNRSLSPQQCLKCHKIRVPHVFPQAFSICIRLTITCTICSAPVQLQCVLCEAWHVITFFFLFALFWKYFFLPPLFSIRALSRMLDSSWGALMLQSANNVHLLTICAYIVTRQSKFITENH